MTLALLSLLSTTIGGYFYYSSSKNYAYRDAYKRAEATVKIAANRITSRLAEHQKAVKALAGLKEIRTLAAGKNTASISDTNSILDHFNSAMDVDVCYLMDQSGNTIASSNRNKPDSFVGQNYSFRPYFTQALKGGPSIYMALGVTSKKRGIYFSYPVYMHNSDEVIGVAVIKSPADRIDAVLDQFTDGTILFTGPHGVIFASNRDDWLYDVLWNISDDEMKMISDSKQFGTGPWDWTGMKRISAERAADNTGADYMVHEVEIKSYPGWQVVYLWTFKSISDTFMVPLFRTVGNIIFALCIIIGLAVLVLYKKASRDITARKEAEVSLEKAYGELEDRVKDRTADLANSNEQLKAEIKERTRVEDALIRSESGFRDLSQEFNALLNAIPDSLTLLSSDLKILWANEGTSAFLDKGVTDIKGQHCYSKWHNRSEPCEPCPVTRAFVTGNIESATMRTPDDRIWDLRAVPIRNEKGEINKVIEVARDVTQHRKLEEQLLHAQKMEAVGQLAGGVAHEFNNILTAIINNIYLAQKSTEGGGPAKDNLEKVLKLSNNAAIIARELLAFSRKQYMDLSPVKLNKVVKSAEGLLKNFISEDIEISVQLTDKDPTVMADRHQIEQVIINLATNARDAMPGGGSLTIETDIREMDSQFVKAHGFGSPGTYAFLSVTDTGEGISEEIRQKVFEPFFTTKEVGKGTGLGLSIVYGIITQHNGYVNVDSEPGKGTTFRIFLPEIRASAISEDPAVPALHAGRGEYILLAEDEASVRDSIKSVLEGYGYRVLEAADGKDAVEKFMEHKDAVDLLIFDIIMPGKNGREAYEEIKKIRPDIKAVFISGYTSDIIRSKRIFEEDLTFVSKPVYPDKLLSIIREILEGSDEGAK